MLSSTRQDRPGNLLRPPGGSARVTNVELFFDLVYVFAVTQLSHYLLDHRTVGGALQALLLLAMVWLAWAYTTWVTNWLDPERIPVRLMLLGLALVSLVMSAALPFAFAGRGLAVGGAYALMQIGRSVFAVAGLRGQRLQRNFQRILAWCVASGTLAVAGGLVAGHARELLWLGAVAVDVLGGLVGFYTPGLGRSRTRDWTIEGNHFAERCQAFILIALGESIVVIGAALSALASVTAQEIIAFLAAFTGSVGLWWLYFHRSAEESTQVIASSADPGGWAAPRITSSTRSWWPGSSWSRRGTSSCCAALARWAAQRSPLCCSAAPPCSCSATPRSRPWSGAGCRGRGSPGSWSWPRWAGWPRRCQPWSSACAWPGGAGRGRGRFPGPRRPVRPVSPVRGQLVPSPHRSPRPPGQAWPIPT